MKLPKKNRVPETAITEKALRRLLKREIRSSSSIADWATDQGITPQAVSSFIHGVQGAGLQIPEALGYRPQTVFLPVSEELICKTPSRSKKVAKKSPPKSKREDLHKESKRRLEKRNRK